MPPLVYNDFAIRFETDGQEGIRARVAPHSGDSAPTPFVSPFTPKSLTPALEGLEAELRRPGGAAAVRRVRPRHRRPVRNPAIESVGGALFDALLHGAILEAFRDACALAQQEGRGLRLRLIFDPEAKHGGVPLAALPWELLFDPRNERFLSHNPRTPVVRYLRRTHYANPRLRPVSDPLRILVLQAQPHPYPPLELAAERRRIEASVGRGHDLQMFFVEPPTRADLRRALREHAPHVLHFMGHGTLDKNGLGEVLLETPEGRPAAVSSRKLATVLSGCESLRLVVLNACETGQMPRREGLDPFSSMATALVQGGLPAVVSMQFPISDRAAIAFAGDFYRALAAGDPLEAAVTEGRQAIYNELDNGEWLTPTLHMRVEHGHLFRSRTEPGLESRIQGQEALIGELRKGFVGREFVFSKIDDFMAAHDRGYFMILGDPGIGKSALAAQLIHRYGAIYHFNIRSNSEANRTSHLLENLCAQLIVRWRLPHTTLPAEALSGPSLLSQLLTEATARLPSGERCLVVIDAVDEVIDLDSAQGNLLHLPTRLPAGAFVLLTTRRPPKEPSGRWSLQTDSPYEGLELIHDSAGNMADIRRYIEEDERRHRLAAWWRPRGLDREEFVDLLEARSEGNFRYLHHVLPEFRDGGLYQDQNLDRIPQGLTRYYRDHWQRMRELCGADWFDYQLPVVAALTAVDKPIPFELIHFLTRIQQPARVLAVLLAWDAFLHQEEDPSKKLLLRRYRLYHQTFIDFVSQRDDVDLTRTVRQMKDLLYQDFLDQTTDLRPAGDDGE